MVAQFLFAIVVCVAVFVRFDTQSSVEMRHWQQSGANLITNSTYLYMEYIPLRMFHLLICNVYVMTEFSS